MSFILDALKKSENERQRTIGPSLADAPLRIAPTERPWWAIAVAALLVVNLAVLAFVLLRHEDPAPAPVAPPQASPPAVAAAPIETPAPRTAPPAPRTGSNPAVRSLAEEAAAGEYYDAPIDGEYIDPAYPGLASAANIPAGPPVVRPIEPPAVAPLQNRPTYQPRPTASDEILGGPSDLRFSRMGQHGYNAQQYGKQFLHESSTGKRVNPARSAPGHRVGQANGR